MKQIRTYMLALLCVFTLGTAAQEAGGTSFSLQQAIEYAMKNSPNYLNANSDIVAAKYEKRTIAGIGYPQISGSFNLQNFIKIPTMVIPNFVSPAVYAGLVAAKVAPPDPVLLSQEGYDPLPAQFGMKYQASATASVTQLIFSSDYIVGLQAAKYLENIATINADRSRADVVSGVSKAYYSVLVNSARLTVLSSNIERLQATLNETKAYNQQGFVELIDVERLEVAYNNLLTERQNIERLMTLSDAALRFQMGYMGNETLTLTDKLPDSVDQQEITASKAEYAQRPEYQLLTAQSELNALNLRKEKLGYLPTIAAFASGGYNAFSPEFNLFNKSTSWYPNLVIGAAISINIFDGLQRYNRIQKVKLDIGKSQQNLRMITQSVDLEVNSAIVALNNAIASLKSQTRNRELAKHIQEVSQKKYQEGVGSNLEVITAEAALREAEANYYNAIYNMLVAKIDYQKATGTLVK